MAFSLIAGAKSGCCSSKRRTRFIAPCRSPCSARLSACCNCRVTGDSAGRPAFCARTAVPPAANSAAKRTTAGRRFAVAQMVILRKLDAVVCRFAGDHSLPLAHHIEPVGRQIGERFLFSIRPQDFGLIETLMAAQPEVYAQVVLRQITPAAEDFAYLHQVSGGSAYTRIQGQTIALYAFQLETDPMVLWASFGTQNHGLAHQIFNHGLHLSVVEKVAHSKPAADLRDLNRLSSQPAGIPEGSVPLIDKEKFWLQVSGGQVRAVHLRIHVPVDQEEILPAIVVEIDKGVAPAYIALRASRNAGPDRHIAEVHPAVVAIEGGVLDVKM